MKRTIALILFFSIVLALCACSSGSQSSASSSAPVATVVRKNGETEMLTAEELCNIYSGNSVAFKSKYYYAEVTVTGKVKSVEGPGIYNGQSRNWTIEVSGGGFYTWEAYGTSYTDTNVTSSFLADLNVGDTVEITGKLISGFASQCELTDDVYVYKLDN